MQQEIGTKLVLHDGGDGTEFVAPQYEMWDFKAKGMERPHNYDEYAKKVQIVGVYAYKGGVGKTSSTYAMAWEAAKRGRRVMMVDSDPQESLTAMVLNRAANSREFANLANEKHLVAGDFREYLNHTARGTRSLKKEDQPQARVPTNLWDLWVRLGSGGAVDRNFLPCELVRVAESSVSGALYLLPGSEHFTGAEYFLHEKEGKDAEIDYLNWFGGFYHGFLMTAEKYDIDLILIDMSPTVGIVQKTLLMSCTHFVLPCFPDFLSLQSMKALSRFFSNEKPPAHDALRRLLYGWVPWKEAKIAALEHLQAAGLATKLYLPRSNVKFLGFFFSRCPEAQGQVEFEMSDFWGLKRVPKAHQPWVEQLNVECERLVANMPQNMLSDWDGVQRLWPNKEIPTAFQNKHLLGRIGDLLSIGPSAQRASIPGFALEDGDFRVPNKDDDLVEPSGTTLDSVRNTRDRAKLAYGMLMDRVLSLLKLSHEPLPEDHVFGISNLPDAGRLRSEIGRVIRSGEEVDQKQVESAPTKKRLERSDEDIPILAPKSFTKKCPCPKPCPNPGSGDCLCTIYSCKNCRQTLRKGKLAHGSAKAPKKSVKKKVPPKKNPKSTVSDD